MKIDYKTINGLVNHDPETITKFYLEYANVLASYINKFVNDKNDAADIAYNLLVDLPDLINKYYKSLDDESGLIKWMYTIAKHRAINFIKKSSKIDLVESIDVYSDCSFIDELISFKIENLQKVMSTDLYNVLYLRYKMEYRVGEIAGILHISNSQVSKKLKKAHTIAKKFIMEVYKV